MINSNFSNDDQVPCHSDEGLTSWGLYCQFLTYIRIGKLSRSLRATLFDLYLPKKAGANSWRPGFANRIAMQNFLEDCRQPLGTFKLEGPDGTKDQRLYIFFETSFLSLRSLTRNPRWFLDPYLYEALWITFCFGGMYSNLHGEGLALSSNPAQHFPYRRSFHLLHVRLWNFDLPSRFVCATCLEWARFPAEVC